MKITKKLYKKHHYIHNHYIGYHHYKNPEDRRNMNLREGQDLNLPLNNVQSIFLSNYKRGNENGIMIQIVK